MWLTKARMVAVAVLALVAAGATAVAVAGRLRAEKPGPAPAPVLVPGTPAALRLPADMLPRVGLRVGEVTARAPLPPRTLDYRGSLALDPDHIVRIHSRFSGIVTMLRPGAEGESIHVGDRIKKGEVLASVWSKDVGEKKGELLDALVQLKNDQAVLERFEKAYQEGTLPEIHVHQQRRAVEADRNAVNRAERTLAVWRVPDDEIKAVKDEADRVLERRGKHDTDTEKRWAQEEIRAPLDGTLVEKNVNVGEVVDPNAALYTIANLDRLLVLVAVAETDLPALQALPPEQRRWTVRIPADPDAEPLHGPFDEIGTTIDPNTGTATVKGRIDNPEHRLHPGQFVRVTIEVPHTSHEVTVPTSAVVEEDKDNFIFVQPDPQKLEYARRRILVVRRGRDVVHVRSPLTAEEERQGYETLRPGDRVVTAGAIDLQALWTDLQAREKR